MSTFKRRDGFVGEKMLEIPHQLLQKTLQQNPFLKQLYLTQIGYFPKAFYHYRERRNGCHDNILFYCLKGKGWYIIDKHYFEIRANEYAIIPATAKYIRYGADMDEPWTIYWVHYTGNEIEDMNRSLGITADRGPRAITFNDRGITTWEIMYNSLERGLNNESLFNANFCLYKFVASFLFSEQWEQKPVSQTGLFVDAVKAHMQQHVNSRITIPEMAAAQGISVSYFSQQFRKATGIAPLDYFIQLKIRHSCLLLLNHSIKIKEVARHVGMDDPYYFSRMFKKYMAISPQQYRLQKRTDADNPGPG